MLVYYVDNNKYQHMQLILRRHSPLRLCIESVESFAFLQKLQHLEIFKLRNTVQSTVLHSSSL
jgi:hypothetical protein